MPNLTEAQKATLIDHIVVRLEKTPKKTFTQVARGLRVVANNIEKAGQERTGRARIRHIARTNRTFRDTLLLWGNMIGFQMTESDPAVARDGTFHSTAVVYAHPAAQESKKTKARSSRT